MGTSPLEIKIYLGIYKNVHYGTPLISSLLDVKSHIPEWELSDVRQLAESLCKTVADNNCAVSKDELAAIIEAIQFCISPLNKSGETICFLGKHILMSYVRKRDKFDYLYDNYILGTNAVSSINI